METILTDLFFPEGPRWSKAQGCLYFSDILGKGVFRLTTSHQAVSLFDPGEKPSGLGWLPNGDLLVVLTESQTVVRLPKGADSVQPYADLSTDLGTQCNDMVVGPDGTAYAGLFLPGLTEAVPPGPENPPRLGYVMRVCAGGATDLVASRVSFPNGGAITPDGKTYILAETFAYMLSAWDIHSDGSLGHRRPFAYLGVPTDGISLDAEGCVWVACPYFQYGDSGGYVRVADGGDIKQVIRVEDPNISAYACCLGGQDGRDLYLCESTVLGKTRHPGDGRIRRVRVDVPMA
jgi:sugar lactone lactonase YvrE